VPSVAGGAEHAAGVVAAPVVAAVRAEGQVLAAAAVQARAGASLTGVLVLELAGDQLVQERRQVDGQARLPARAAIRVVLGDARSSHPPSPGP